MKAYDIKYTNDLSGTLADLIGDTVESMMQAELEADLGYSKYDTENKEVGSIPNYV